MPMTCPFSSREDEYLMNMQHTVIPSWYQRGGYIKAMADLIEKELQKFDCPEEVIFVLHMYSLICIKLDIPLLCSSFSVHLFSN